MVWRARDTETGDVVALKTMKSNVATPDLVARMKREACVLASLEHPNCLRYHAHGLDARGLPYLATELLAGRDLRDSLVAPVPVRQALALMEQLLTALEHIHAKGVVHRDVKPENIVLIRGPNGSERVVLIDFGLALIEGSAVLADGHRTSLGLVMGTPGAMSPEQILAQPVDARADLYCAGTVFYQLLTACCPFPETSPEAILALQLRGEAVPLPPHVPPCLKRLVKRLMAPDPVLRPACAGEARRALRCVEDAVSPGRRATWIDLLGPRSPAGGALPARTLPRRDSSRRVPHSSSTKGTRRPSTLRMQRRASTPSARGSS